MDIFAKSLHSILLSVILLGFFPLLCLPSLSLGRGKDLLRFLQVASVLLVKANTSWLYVLHSSSLVMNFSLIIQLLVLFPVLFFKFRSETIPVLVYKQRFKLMKGRQELKLKNQWWVRSCWTLTPISPMQDSQWSEMIGIVVQQCLEGHRSSHPLNERLISWLNAWCIHDTIQI